MNEQQLQWIVRSVTLILLVSGGSVHATNKALLIATTAYEDTLYDLPGISFDIQEMERFARKLGFVDKNIKKLTGTEVTLENVERQFKDYLTSDVGPDDNVFIYYSGHGLQVPDLNGDEDDRRDEAISMHDLAPAPSGWNGVLIDDRFAELLRGLNSENVVVIVDACHSGTVTRSYTFSSTANTRAYGDDEFAVKALAYRGENSRSLSPSAGTVTDELPVGVISLSAAQDHQQSLASKKGSLFTLALVEALEHQRNSATPKALIDAATALLDERLDEEYVFTPNLSGDERLFNKPIVISETQASANVNRSDLFSMSSTLTPLTVSTNQTRYANDALIELAVNVPADGFINIVAVDSADEVVVLFPNGFDKDNHVTVGQKMFPGQREFSWLVQPPWGKTMVTVLFSTMPVNLFESSVQRTQSGTATSDYVLPSLSAFELFKQKQNRTAAGSVFIETCETDISCG